MRDALIFLRILYFTRTCDVELLKYLLYLGLLLIVKKNNNNNIVFQPFMDHKAYTTINDVNQFYWN